MDVDGLIQEILVTIGIPIITLVIITPIKAMSSKHDLTTESGVEIGMDIALLAAGACGGIFANESIYKVWGKGVTSYGIFVAFSCIAFVVWLAWIRKRQEGTNPSMAKAIFNIFLGTIPLGMVTSILALGYTYSR